jgi:hypothetical protein
MLLKKTQIFPIVGKMEAIIERVKKKITPTPDPPAAPNQEKPPVAPAAGNPAPGKKAPAPAANKKSRKPRAKAAAKKGKKTHQKKGAVETIPNTLRLDLPGFAALRALEAEMPDQTRVQIVSNVLRAMAGQTALLTPIHLRRLSKDDLLLLAGQIADSEAMLKEILRKIIRARIDPVKKEELVDELLSEIKEQQELRRQVCRMTGIPISHDTNANVRITIKKLIEEKNATSSKSIQNAYEDAIQILSVFTVEDGDLTALNS